MSYTEDRRLHHAVDLIGLRAHATAIGLVQLTIELRRTGVFGDDAVGRIKQAMANEISLTRPRSAEREKFEADVRARLDRIFAGEEALGELPKNPPAAT